MIDRCDARTGLLGVRGRRARADFVTARAGHACRALKPCEMPVAHLNLLVVLSTRSRATLSMRDPSRKV